MTEVRVKFPNIEFESPAFRCYEADCTRYFTNGRGYFDTTHDGSVLAEKYQQLCPSCKTPMYLESIVAEAELWRCPLDACGQQQRMVS
jgi:hypothetical protein